MNKGKILVTLSVICLVGAGLLLQACDSSNTASGGEPDSDSQFVATDEAAGSITLTVRRNPLPVAETSRFTVSVVDATGAPVPQIRISCDTERELALVEPTSGIELTDAWGNMSGVVGCVAEGSFQIGCRLPIGGNKRKWETVVCQGAAPDGFEGWPEAGGGGIGGGVDTTGEEDESSLGTVRVTDISFSDGGQSDTTSIDVVQDVCDATSTPVALEFFTDTTATITVKNSKDQTVRFTRYSYEIEDFDGTGQSHFSPILSFVGEASAVLAADGGTGSFQVLFIDASGGGKRYFNRSDLISGGGIGFKNVRFKFYGTDASGNSIIIRARTGISLDNYDRC